MTFHNAIGVVVILVSTAALAQIAQSGATTGAPIPNRQGVTGRQGLAGNKAADPLAAMRQQVADMESTVSKMHAALKQMHAKAAKSKVMDPETKANIDLWELMVAHLDKELEQTRAALAQREDLEVRRAALYKQADAKAAAEAEKFRAAQAARFAQAQQNANGSQTSTPPGQNAEQSHPAQTAPAPPDAAPATNNSASPN